MKIKAILFDLDGTLLDTAPDFIVCVNRLRQNHQMTPLADDVIRAQVSNGARALTLLASELQENDPLFEARRLELLGHYAEVLGKYSALFDGMASSLQWIAAQGLAWGIITNKPSAYTNPLLERIALPSQPATVVCPDHVTRSKPDPEPMLLACSQLGIAPAEAVYVGDHARDIEAGRRAGMLTIACAYGYLDPGERIEDWQADFLISQPNELPASIKRLIESIN